MSQYKKKPVVVDAEQFSYDGPPVRGVFYPSVSPDGRTYEGDAFVITMHDQRVYLQSGDWIIAEPDGEHFYPCKDDVFGATYEPVEAQPYMTINANSELPPETAEALAEVGRLVVEQDTEEIDWFNAPIEQVDAELRKFDLDPEQVGKTGARLAEAWIEAQRQKMRAEAAEAQAVAIQADRDNLAIHIAKLKEMLEAVEEYATARRDAPYNDTLTFAGFLAARQLHFRA